MRGERGGQQKIEMGNDTPNFSLSNPNTLHCASSQELFEVSSRTRLYRIFDLGKCAESTCRPEKRRVAQNSVLLLYESVRVLGTTSSHKAKLFRSTPDVGTRTRGWGRGGEDNIARGKGTSDVPFWGDSHVDTSLKATGEGGRGAQSSNVFFCAPLVLVQIL